MAITSLTKRNSGDGVDRKKGETQAFEDRQTEEWDIVVSEAGYSSSRILAEAALPAAYSPHPDNPNLRCTGEHQVRRVDGSPIHFVAIVTYDTPPPGSPLPEPEQPSENRPEKRDREPYLEEWDTVESQEPIDTDINNAPIITINGEQFDPPITKDVHDIQMTFGKKLANKNSTLSRAAGKTNSALFKEFGRGQCLIKSVKFKYLTDPDSNQTYWRQTVTIVAREAPVNNAGNDPILGPDVWKKRIRAEGYLIKVDGQQEPVNAKDAEGNPSAVPVLHDKATGERIDDPKQAQWYPFQVYEEIDFGTLNID
jgi:hypothetical protein